MEQYARDDSPAAYARLVDRLLASPRYGERWARHWLDLVRFGESNGFEYDELRPTAWPYRDWVVQALNRDMPYDEFARMQVAGDVLYPSNPSALVATGFLVAGAFDTVGQNQQSEAMKKVVRQDELEDVVSTVGQTFLALTVHCARCHDHKFDPIRQAEYYRMTAALAGVRHGERDLEPPSRLPMWLQKYLHVAPPRQAHAVAPRPPEVAHVLLRGNPAQQGPVVTPGGLAAVAETNPDFCLPADAPDGARRAKLARWLTDRRNPLFARAIVNRLWHYHFGTGLVDTPNDFGFNGGRPSHPELLDWLAAELIRQNFSLKKLHRLIVLSAAYRQSSRFRPEAAKVDAGNRLLWRKNPLRLEAEAVRDCMLVCAGKLNPLMGGPGYRDFKVNVRGATYEYTPVDDDSPALHRRTIYRTWARSGRSGLLDTLDCPDPSTLAPTRAVTTTPLQALALMNNSFVLRMAEHFAARLKQEAGENLDRQAIRAYELAYGRAPSDEELRETRKLPAANGLVILCRAIFNSNEFIYAD